MMTIRAAALLATIAVVAGSCGPLGPTGAAPARATPIPTQLPDATPITTVTRSPSESRAPTVTPAPTSGSAIVPGVVDRTSLEIVATYDAVLSIKVGGGAVTVDVEIDAQNVSGAVIDRLELNTIAAPLGAMMLIATSVDGRPVAATAEDQTIRVPLGGLLPDDASTEVRVSYRATLQPDLSGSDWLFTQAGGTVALYRWIPWVSRATPFERPNHGDPFVTPSSQRVRVRVTTDVPMILASAGSEPILDGLTWSFEALDVRDVAVVLAPDFERTDDTVDGVAIRVYTRPGGLDPEQLMTRARRALGGIAAQVAVPYPWASFTVVETAGGYGMESPGMIWIPRQTGASNLAYLVHHETAHQWFYGLVGNDQQAEPFADEAAADLTARTVLGSMRASRCQDAPLDRAITRYGNACYYEVVYIQGGNVLDAIRARMGSARFWATMGAYLDLNAFELAGTRQLLDTLRAASPVDLGPILRARFPSLY